MEEFEKWLNEQKNSVAWSLLGEDSRLYQAWASGAMNQARLISHAPNAAMPSTLEILTKVYGYVNQIKICLTFKDIDGIWKVINELSKYLVSIDV